MYPASEPPRFRREGRSALLAQSTCWQRAPPRLCHRNLRRPVAGLEFPDCQQDAPSRSSAGRLALPPRGGIGWGQLRSHGRALLRGGALRDASSHLFNFFTYSTIFIQASSTAPPRSNHRPCHLGDHNSDVVQLAASGLDPLHLFEEGDLNLSRTHGLLHEGGGVFLV